MGLLERVQPDEIIYGYQFNRLSDALSGLRIGLSGIATIAGYVMGPFYDSVDVGAGVTRTRTRFVIPDKVFRVFAVQVYFTCQTLHAPKQTQSSSGATGTGSGNTGAGTAHTHIQNSHAHTENTAAAYTQNATTASATATDQNESAHTHDMSAISITIPQLNLNNPSTVIETGMAQGVHLYVDGTDRTTVLGGPWGSGSALDVGPLDITSYLSGTQIGWHEIRMSSTALGGITTLIVFTGLANFGS